MVPSFQPVPAQGSQPGKAAKDAAWASFFARLLQFKQEHGHFHIPLTNPENKSLAWWANRQRTRMAAGTMQPERLQRLQAAGFPGESHLDSLAAKSWNRIWDQHFAALMEFHRINGHFDVPRDIGTSGRLREWVDHQLRKFYSGRLKPERRQKLVDVGFFNPFDVAKWNPDDPRPSDPWNVKYNDLVAFYTRFGHCYVPHPWPEQPGLGVWVQDQRKERQAGTLSAEHIARLDEIHFIWTGGWEVLGEDWRQKRKEAMGRYYHDPETPPEHFWIYRKPVIRYDEDDLENR